MLCVKNITQDAAFCTDAVFCAEQKDLFFLNKKNHSANFNLWSFSFALPASRKYIYIQKSPKPRTNISYKQEKKCHLKKKICHKITQGKQGINS